VATVHEHVVDSLGLLSSTVDLGIVMIYSLVLIAAGTVTTMGHYDTERDCVRASEQFRAQSVTAGCVRQQSVQEQQAAAEQMFQSFMRIMPK